MTNTWYYHATGGTTDGSPTYKYIIQALIYRYETESAADIGTVTIPQCVQYRHVKHSFQDQSRSNISAYY